MARIFCSCVVSILLWTSGLMTVVFSAQSTPASAPIQVKAVLVLTPEFCETKIKPKGSWATKEPGNFEVGQAACAELEPALKTVFPNLTRVSDERSVGEAQLVLVPKVVDASATKATMAMSDRELVVLLQWTVKDASGKTVWLETVQGSAKHHIGNAFTHGKNMKLIVDDSVKDAAAKSAEKMESSPELHKAAVATPTGNNEKN